MFSVSVCGQLVVTMWPEHQTVLDTLWNHHFSSQETDIFEVQVGQLCSRLPLDKRFVSIRHVVGLDKLESRKNQKVKIISVSMFYEID